MIIWIDGPYGSGKTSVTTLLSKRHHNLKSVFADAKYGEWLNLGENREFAFAGGGTPQRNKQFIAWFKEYLLEDKRETLVVDMTIANNICKELLYDKVVKRVKAHIILEIDREVMTNRVQKQERPDFERALSTYDEHTRFLTENYLEAIRIDVSNRTVEQVVQMVEGLILN